MTSDASETVVYSRQLPVARRCDVLVVGGGPAGVAAAIAAARNGARTLLVEQYGALGGMGTVGLVGPFMTSFSADGRRQIIAGIFDELVRRMAAVGGAIHPSEVPPGSSHSGFIVRHHGNVTPFDPEALKLVAGRCISATHEAAGAVRVMPPCFATGQAAGTAAALAVRLGVPPREVPVDELRRTLAAQGQVLEG